jgi:protocatechuate 3,4-dioxygenase beta subunit
VPRTAQPGLEAESLAGRWLSEPEAEPRSTTSQPEPQPGAADLGANAPAKAALHIAVNDRRMSALRGGKQVLTGRIADRGEKGVSELRVEVWIARAKPRERMLLGVTTTDADGYFRAAFGVPPDLAVGDYRMLVVSPGDEYYQPVVSE